MALSTRLGIKQSQNLVMTPQLMQSIKLLQYNHLELSAFVEAELEKNPLLERVSPDENVKNDDLPQGSEKNSADQLTGDEAIDFDANSIAGSLDSDSESLFPEQTSLADAGNGNDLTLNSSSGNSLGSSDNDFSVEMMEDIDITLANHLRQQLGHFDLTPIQSHICLHLIDLLDDAGYITVENADICLQLNAEEADVNIAIDAIQNMEPSGIGARNLRECLALQLRDKNRLDPWTELVLDNLDLIAQHNLAKLRKVTMISEEDILDIIKDIKSLDPKPGLAFGFTPTQTAIPDVYITKNAQGEWRVELNTQSLPNVLVNEKYYAEIKSLATKEDDKVFLNEKLQDASWLVKSLDQRARTILNVSREIVRQQDSFFNHGITHLKPLNLNVIAEAIDMHESTISRVTSNKFMATPRGVFDMRYFFSSAIQNADGEQSVASHSVKHRIKALVDEESPKAILSDDAIVKKLKLSGIDVARRTVAKYREALNIPSSVERRRIKKQQLVD